MAQAGQLTCVIDASALLAFLRDENGQEFVSTQLAGAVICAVNLHEVYTRLIDLADERGLERLEAVVATLDIRSFDIEMAKVAADFRAGTRDKGLSLGDRACLAMGAVANLPILTADRRMASVEVGLDLRLIR